MINVPPTLLPSELSMHLIYSRYRGLQGDVVYLSWPIAPSYTSLNTGEGAELRGLSQWEQLCTYVTWRPNKLWRSNSIFNLWVDKEGQDLKRGQCEAIVSVSAEGRGGKDPNKTTAKNCQGVSFLYSTPRHLPPLRFHCVGGCFDWREKVYTVKKGSRLSHPRMSLTNLTLAGNNLIIFAQGEFGGKWHTSWGRENR